MRGPRLTSLIVLLATVALAPELRSQDIRNYGPQDGGGGGGGTQGQQRLYYPGQPVPQTGNQQQTGQAQQQTDNAGQQTENEEGIGENYAIRIYQPGDYEDGEPEGDTAGMNRQSGQQVPDPVGKPDDQIYQGVIPGIRDTVQHLRAAAATSRSGPNPVTWVGFKAEDDRTRVFIQTAQAPRFSRSRSENNRVLTIEIANSKLAERNFARRIDASAYDRVVERVHASEQSDGTVAIRIDLRETKSPEISSSGRYLYIDFPRGGPDQEAPSNRTDRDSSAAESDSNMDGPRDSTNGERGNKETQK